MANADKHRTRGVLAAWRWQAGRLLPRHAARRCGYGNGATRPVFHPQVCDNAKFLGGTVRQWLPSLAFHRFGDLRSFAFEENADCTCMIRWARNSANRQKLAIESRALARKVQQSERRIPTRLNRTHARAPFGFGVRRMGYVNSVRLTCADSEQVTRNA